MDNELKVSFKATHLNNRTYVFIPRKDYTLVADDDGNYVFKDTNFMLEHSQSLPEKEGDE